jgi:hypothetical protein
MINCFLLVPDGTVEPSALLYRGKNETLANFLSVIRESELSSF